MTAQDSMPPVTTDETQSGVSVRSGVWLGACVGCGNPIHLSKVPRPCHVPRLKCKKCRLAKMNRNSKASRRRHHDRLRRYNTTRGRKLARMAQIKRTNTATKLGATMWYQKWGDVEDAYLVENSEKTHRQLARELGRTLHGVKRRIWRLRKAPNEKADPQPRQRGQEMTRTR